jgi:hypothetical protein
MAHVLGNRTAEVVAQREAAAVMTAVDQVEAETLADRSEGDILVASEC